MKTLALELGQYGITANCVAPGEIATPMTGQEDEDPHTTRRPGVPLGRPGDAREIASVVAFLASPQASYVTGASWPVDGGMLQMGPQAGSPHHHRRLAHGLTRLRYPGECRTGNSGCRPGPAPRC